MKNVVIDIKSTQEIENDSTNIEMSVLGSYSVRDNKFLLSYEDAETFKPHSIKTLIKAENSKVTMIRSGAADNRMVIEKGQRHDCFYAIPHAKVTLGIFGENVLNTLNNCGGTLKLDYTISIENSMLSRNTVEISVKEVKNNVTNS